MPKKRQHKKLGWFGTGMFIFLISAIVPTILFKDGAPLFLCAAMTLFCFLALLRSGLAWEKRTQRIATERKEETICTFARQLNCREIDTWIICAAYEELLDYFGYPPHLDDRFDEIDPEDLDEMGISISKRIGRPLKNTENNPYWGEVKTVQDLILFFTAQPVEERPLGSKNAELSA